MLLKFVRFVGFSIAGMALANSAWAQDANVTTGAASAKLGGELRSEFKYTNNGLQKTDDYTPPASSTFELQDAKLSLAGKLNSSTEYAMRFDLLDGGEGPTLRSAIDYAYGTHWFSDMVGFSLGQMKTLEGGWDVYTSNYRTHAIGVYEDNLPVDLYQPMLAVHMKAAGQVTLQLFNDETTATGAEWNKSEHPTFAIGWMGKFGPIEPIINLGTYDNQKSRWIDVGVRTNMSGLMASLDFNQNTVSHKVAAAGEDPKSKEDVATNIALRAAYEIKGSAIPWIYFSTFDNKQNADASAYGKDQKVNEYVEADAATMTPAHMAWNDNGQVLGLGADLPIFGEGFTPYVALVNRSGKWMEGTDEKTKSEMMVRIGVLGAL